MTLSLMNILSAQTAPAPVATVKGEAASVPAQDGAKTVDFEAVMNAAGDKGAEVLQQLRQLLVAQQPGVDAQAAFEGKLPEVVTQLLQGKGAELGIPAELALAVQDVVVQAATVRAGNATPEEILQNLSAQLPERELTAEELSDIAAMTGLSAQAILIALQETPAASPSLAAELGISLEAAPAVSPEAEAQVAPSVQNVEKASVDVGPVEAPVDSAVSPERLQALEKIVSVLQGNSTQPELPEEWVSRLAGLAEQFRPAKGGAETKNASKDASISVSLVAAADAPAEPVAVNENIPLATAPAQNSEGGVQIAEAPQSGAQKEKPKANHVAHHTEQAPAQKQEAAAQPKVQPSLQLAQTPAEEQAGDAASVNVQMTISTVKTGETASANLAQSAPQVGVVAGTTTTVGTEPSAPLQTTPRPALMEEPVTDQVAVHVKRAVDSGESSIQVRLKPVELGSVDIRIETAADGQSRVHVTAERRDTLELLQRDARALERALQDIGFKADNSSLSFNLRGDGQQGQHAANHSDRGQEQGKFSLDGGYAQPETDEQNTKLAYDISRAYRLTLDRGVDISV